LTFPLMGWDCYGASRMWFELQQTIPEFGAEFAKYKEIFHWLPMPAVLNANKVLRVPADFKGLKIQSSGMMMHLFRSIGAVPIRQSPPDWYTSLERGLIDGISTGIAAVTMFKLQEVTKVHILPAGDSFGFPAIAVIMNRKKFDSLPPAVQKAIDDQVQWASERMNAIDDAENPKSLEICRKLGHTIVQLTPDEMKLWYAAVKPLQEKWIQDMEAKKLPGRKVFEEAKRLAIKYKKQ
jgi:TRAP-type C4-dicarboxylate transport system substrate-binding protein